MFFALADDLYPRELDVLEKRNIRCASIKPRELEVPNVGLFIHPEDCPIFSFFRILLSKLPTVIYISYANAEGIEVLLEVYDLYELEAGRIFSSWSEEALLNFSEAAVFSGDEQVFPYFKYLKEQYNCSEKGLNAD